jgi:hypothetical protein
MNYFRLSIAAAAVLATAFANAARLDIDLPGVSIPVDVSSGFAGATLTISGPGKIISRQLRASDSGRFSIGKVTLPDGEYRYHIDLAAPALATRAGSGPDGRAAASPASTAKLVPVDGTFRVAAGQIYAASPTASRQDSGSPHTASEGATPASPLDQVIADDLIVQGSECLGLDCVNNENFGFDTLRLKENNTRIQFNDTSTSTGFPNHSWYLVANDSASGGANKFSIDDLTAGTEPFTVSGSAPTNSLFVDSSGRVGLGTSTPVLRLHVTYTDTPGIRLEQTNGGGFTAQTWDVAGNEANFFVRDLTGGSKLPFRIRPGAPTSSIDIAADGSVGVGSASPTARLDVVYSSALDSPAPAFQVRNTDSNIGSSQQVRFAVDSSGNVLARGTISQLSTRTAKENFAPADGRLLLAKLEKMPISSWNYRGAPASERHLGPVAEDFHAAFGLGRSDRYIAPTDEAGIALATVKALQQELHARDAELAHLREQMRALEQRLDRLGH